ncbi:MAG: triose-phosphate isomerase [Oscillospiraceae bacterium]|jgi:triosephosphate isomerase|nr:triose-phosphate isomerase [Oscillospiraceae bacterium]
MNKALRPAVIAGNWKMNKTRPETKALLNELLPLVKDATCQVIVCPPFTCLETAVSALAGTNIKVGAQNCHWADNGAFTGEVSAGMLFEMGVSHVIIGHSERRQYFGETDETVNKRVRAALDAGLGVILCVGETLSQRECEITGDILALQTKIALMGVTGKELGRIVIAYEPVWAIGTGRTATAEQADEACGGIRGVVAGLYGDSAAGGLAIQYGGSMNAANASELLGRPHVDGGLIGGASLKPADFAAIVAAACQ